MRARVGAALERTSDYLPEVQESVLGPSAPDAKGAVVRISFCGHVYTIASEVELVTLVGILNRKAA